jgi:hypothetical protein
MDEGGHKVNGWLILIIVVGFLIWMWSNWRYNSCVEDMTAAGGPSSKSGAQQFCAKWKL